MEVVLDRDDRIDPGKLLVFSGTRIFAEDTEV
ncbi:hypothetical protein PMI05_00433 [Brevibacillus sp. BC25]|nr:hypothetical protein PMI05_00433 [Brevibacillus sp. BC25]